MPRVDPTTLDRRTPEEIYAFNRRALIGMNHTLAERIRANLDLARRYLYADPRSCARLVRTARLQGTWMRSNTAALRNLAAKLGIEAPDIPQVKWPMRSPDIVPFDARPLLAALADDPKPIFPPKRVDPPKIDFNWQEAPASIAVMSGGPFRAAVTAAMEAEAEAIRVRAISEAEAQQMKEEAEAIRKNFRNLTQGNLFE